MKQLEVRNWLGLYFLLITSILGGVILLFGSSFLRLDDPIGVFEIIIPVLIGQLAIIVQWFAGNPAPDAQSKISMPVWIIKGPPLIVVALLAIAVALKVAGFYYDQPSWALSDAQFKGVVTFCVSLLNATTIYVISAYFKTR